MGRSFETGSIPLTATNGDISYGVGAAPSAGVGISHDEFPNHHFTNFPRLGEVSHA